MTNKINSKNYFQETKGTFEVLKNRVNAESVSINTLKRYCELLTFKKLRINFISNTSVYFVGKDDKGSFLIRVSDHWGKDIRSCSWNLNDETLEEQKKECQSYSTYKIGKIYFKELLENK